MAKKTYNQLFSSLQGMINETEVSAIAEQENIDKDQALLLGAMRKSGKNAEINEVFSEIVTTWINPNHLVTNYFDFLGLNPVRLNEGDSRVSRIRSGAKVRTYVPGAEHLSNEIEVKSNYQYVLDGAQVGINFSEDDLANGSIGTMSEIRSEMNGALMDYYQTKSFTALSNVWNAANTPSNYTDVSGVLTYSALYDAVNRINQTTPGAASIIGSREALTPMLQFAGGWEIGNTDQANVDTVIEEVVRTGWLGTWMGAKVIAFQKEVNNPYDNTRISIPTDKVMVIGEGIGEFITYGDVKPYTHIDTKVIPPRWYLSIVQTYGMLITNAEGIYVLDNLTASP